MGLTHVVPEGLYLPASKGPRGWGSMNLRTAFEQTVLRKGLEPWPRLFRAMRVSCESDLAREYPITAVCKWIGNTVAIAARHYVQVTDDDFRRAFGAVQQAAQSPAQQTPGTGRKGVSEDSHPPRSSKEDQGVPTHTSVQAEGTGIEPATPFGAPHFQCGR